LVEFAGFADFAGDDSRISYSMGIRDSIVRVVVTMTLARNVVTLRVIRIVGFGQNSLDCVDVSIKKR